MNIDHDGWGGLIIQTSGEEMALDFEQCAQVVKSYLDGLCHICHKEINAGSVLCCNCFEAERRWHNVHCETNGKH